MLTAAACNQRVETRRLTPMGKSVQELVVVCSVAAPGRCMQGGNAIRPGMAAQHLEKFEFAPGSRMASRALDSETRRREYSGYNSYNMHLRFDDFDGARASRPKMAPQRLEIIESGSHSGRKTPFPSIRRRRDRRSRSTVPGSIRKKYTFARLRRRKFLRFSQRTIILLRCGAVCPHMPSLGVSSLDLKAALGRPPFLWDRGLSQSARPSHGSPPLSAQRLREEQAAVVQSSAVDAVADAEGKMPLGGNSTPARAPRRP